MRLGFEAKQLISWWATPHGWPACSSSDNNCLLWILGQPFFNLVIKRSHFVSPPAVSLWIETVLPSTSHSVKYRTMGWKQIPKKWQNEREAAGDVDKTKSNIKLLFNIKKIAKTYWIFQTLRMVLLSIVTNVSVIYFMHLQTHMTHNTQTPTHQQIHTHTHMKQNTHTPTHTHTHDIQHTHTHTNTHTNTYTHTWYNTHI